MAAQGIFESFGVFPCNFVGTALGLLARGAERLEAGSAEPPTRKQRIAKATSRGRRYQSVLYIANPLSSRSDIAAARVLERASSQRRAVEVKQIMWVSSLQLAWKPEKQQEILKDPVKTLAGFSSIVYSLLGRRFTTPPSLRCAPLVGHS